MPYKNKEDKKAHDIKYHQEHKEDSKKYYQQNKEKILARNKQWLENNQEYFKEYQKQWFKRNPEYLRIWRKNNKEKELEGHRKWSKTEKGKACNQRRHIKRRVREKEIINTLTANEWFDVLRQHEFKCVYCGKDLFDLFTKPERDHIIPISKGGHNTKENVIPSCRSCNAKKSNKIIK